MATSRENRDKLMSMMAISEDITRTNNRIYDMMMTLADNPGEKNNLYNSINDLVSKVNNLKNVELGSNFIEQEQLAIPTQSDISPKEDPDYKQHMKSQKNLQQRKNERLIKKQREQEITPEEEAHNEVLEEATNTPQPPVPPKRNVRKNTQGTNRQTRQRSKGKNFSNLGKGKEGTQKD